MADKDEIYADSVTRHMVGLQRAGALITNEEVVPDLAKMERLIREILSRDDIQELGRRDFNAMVREVHVYGPALGIGSENDTEQESEIQHRGLGSRLLDTARQISQQEGFRRISVIAAIGTREYYAARGFDPGELYMTAAL